MGKRLTENLTSLYIGAVNNLKPKHAKRKIIAYVESYDDISFGVPYWLNMKTTPDISK